MSAAPRYTVAICTRNRADIVAQSIAAAAAQHDAPPFEIIVIDNGSTDVTSQVVRERMTAVDNLRLIEEPRLGLSVARNRALREARGQVVVYVDDDGTLDADYLKVLDAVWREQQPACAGGPISVAYLDEAPSWWKPEYDAFCGRVDHGDAPRTLHFSQYPYGSNIAVDRAIAIDVGGFDERLGVGPHGPWAAEETELCARLEANGHAIHYHPALRVTHHVRHAGRDLRALLRQRFYRGRSYFYAADSYHDAITWRTFLKQFVIHGLGAFPWVGRTRLARLANAAGALYEVTRLRLTGRWRPRRDRAQPPKLTFPG